MKIFKKIKARIITNYIIKQIQTISKTDTCNEYLRVTENIKKTKCIYVKFSLIDGVKDVHMSFIEFYNSLRKNENGDYLPRKSIFDYYIIYKKKSINL